MTFTNGETRRFVLGPRYDTFSKTNAFATWQRVQSAKKSDSCGYVPMPLRLGFPTLWEQGPLFVGLLGMSKNMGTPFWGWLPFALSL